MGTFLFGPAGAVVGGAAGGVLAGLRNRFHDIGIDDKFMKQVASEVDKGRSALFVLYEGDWSASIGAIRTPSRRTTHCSSRALSSRRRRPSFVRSSSRQPGARWRGSGRRLRGRDRAGGRGRRGAPGGRDGGAREYRRPPNLDGIGPKAAKALTAAGITTYEALAETNEPQLRNALHAADMVAPANVASWPMQAAFAARGDWRGLARDNEKTASVKAPASKAKAPAAAPAAAVKPDDLTQLNGIGPKSPRSSLMAG